MNKRLHVKFSGFNSLKYDSHVQGSGLSFPDRHIPWKKLGVL